MSVLRTFIAAMKRATVEFRMVLVLYAINLVVALVLALSFRSALDAGLGSSMATEQLMEGLNYTVLQECLVDRGKEVDLLFSQIIWFSVVYVLINTLLAGGILSTLREKGSRFSLKEFFTGCGSYVWRFLRLFLLFGVLLVVISVLWVVLLALFFEAVTAEGASEVSYFAWLLVVIVLFFVPVLLLVMIADYAKIGTVMTNTRAMIRAAWRSAKFVFRNFPAVLGLQLLMLIVPVILFVVYLLLDLSIGMTDATTILAMFAIQQLFVLARVWTRVFFFSGEMGLYDAIQSSP